MTSRLLRLSLVVNWDKVQVEDKTLGCAVAVLLIRYGDNDNYRDCGLGWLLLMILEVLKEKCNHLAHGENARPRTQDPRGRSEHQMRLTLCPLHTVNCTHPPPACISTQESLKQTRHLII